MKGSLVTPRNTELNQMYGLVTPRNTELCHRSVMF